MLYFSEPDHTGHDWGVNTSEIVEAVEEMDDLLGYLLQNLAGLKIHPNLNLIIMSDHGMTNVSENKTIVLDDYISRLGDLYLNGRGTHVQFDLKKSKKKNRKSVYEGLKKSEIKATSKNHGGPISVRRKSGGLIGMGSALRGGGAVRSR